MNARSNVERVGRRTFLAGAAGRIGRFELKLAESAGDDERSKTASTLVELAGSLAERNRFVAGDLQALAAALDATTPAGAN